MGNGSSVLGEALHVGAVEGIGVEDGRIDGLQARASQHETAQLRLRLCLVQEQNREASPEWGEESARLFLRGNAHKLVLPFQIDELVMRIIKVATDDGNVYYDIVSRLKRTHLRFSSLSPGQVADSAKDLVITSRMEISKFGEGVVAIEDLSDDPLIMEGQLLSRLLDESRRNLLIGIDPGSKIGMAMFYGGRELGALTANSVEKSVESVVELVEEVPHSSLSAKIGHGEPKSSLRLARMLRERLPPSASVEIVDESGTSAGKRGAIGATRDQRAAARIAFRKGNQFSGPARSRKSHG
jgi:hypothetical protein